METSYAPVSVLSNRCLYLEIRVSSLLYKWKKIGSLYSDDSEKYYNFTELACQLNELEEGIAPTDSRFRPDQRLMENGHWDEANAEKLRLEEKQRACRRAREHEGEKAAAQGNC